MNSSYQVIMRDTVGRYVTDLRYLSLELSRKANNIGGLVLSLDTNIYPPDMFQRDMRIFVKRSVNDGPPYLEGKTVFFVRGKAYSGGINKPLSLKIVCHDANSLLHRRIVAYYPEETETEKEDNASNIILQVCRENFGSDADLIRRFDVEIPSDNNLGPVLFLNIAWRDVGPLIQEIANSSQEQGTYLACDIQCTDEDPMNLILRVQPVLGVDRRWPSGPGGAVRIGPDFGSLDNWTIEDDWTKEQNHLYAGGEGDDDDRLIIEVEDTPVVNQSPFGRIEGWTENREADVTEVLESWANAELHKRVTRTKLTGDLVENDQIIWGVTLGFGDQTTAQVEQRAFDCVINGYTLRNSPADGDDLKVEIESL